MPTADAAGLPRRLERAEGLGRPAEARDKDISTATAVRLVARVQGQVARRAAQDLLHVSHESQVVGVDLAEPLGAHLLSLEVVIDVRVGVLQQRVADAVPPPRV